MATEEKSDQMEGCVLSCMALAMTPVVHAVYGFTLMEFWTWFVVPLGLPGFTFWQAMGLSLLASLLKMRRPERQPTGVEAVGYQLSAIFACGFWLPIGGFAHWMMGAN